MCFQEFMITLFDYSFRRKVQFLQKTGQIFIVTISVISQASIIY